MSRVLIGYVGALVVALAAFGGLVVAPHVQLGRLEPVARDEDDPYPLEAVGQVEAGRRVYAGLGCMYCHSQQVRPAGLGADIERGWGARRTVARDYLHDQPPMLGTMRTGPDLANIGSRQPSASWHSLHLYDPKLTSQDSIMPPHRFLFETRYVLEGRPARALDLPADSSDGDLPEGRYLVPNDDAVALVAYLQSLVHEQPVPEVP